MFIKMVRFDERMLSKIDDYSKILGIIQDIKIHYMYRFIHRDL